jgi:hypothetical protein
MDDSLSSQVTALRKIARLSWGLQTEQLNEIEASRIMEMFPARIWCAMSTYTDDGGHVSVERYWSDVPNDAEFPELAWSEYIRADIAEREKTAAIEAEAAVWLKSANDMVDKQTELGAEIVRLNSEVERLECAIGRMAAREVDAALAQGDALTLNPGEVLWECDNCGQHGVVPAAWGYVPGWTYDDDGKWYCCEICAEFAALKERDNG